MTDHACMLAFLASPRAQHTLRVAAERPSPSDPLDGSCKVLLASREVQEIYQMRWRGFDGLSPRASLRDWLVGRTTIPFYCIARMIYPPLDVSRHVSPALFRHIHPSPRLKFAVHSLFDVALALCLVLAHAGYGSLKKLSHPAARAEFNTGHAQAVYTVLALWFVGLVQNELYGLFHTAKCQFRKLEEVRRRDPAQARRRRKSTARRRHSTAHPPLPPDSTPAPFDEWPCVRARVRARVACACFCVCLRACACVRMTAPWRLASSVIGALWLPGTLHVGRPASQAGRLLRRAPPLRTTAAPIAGPAIPSLTRCLRVVTLASWI